MKEIADRYSLGRVNLLTRPRPEGLSVAFRAGFAWALDHDYNVVVQMDSDGSHPVAVVGALLQSIASSADLALGARCIPGGETDPNWAWHRKVLSIAGNTYTRVVLSLPYKDLTGGFKAWRSDLLRSIVGNRWEPVGLCIPDTYDLLSTPTRCFDRRSAIYLQRADAWTFEDAPPHNYGSLGAVITMRLKSPC